MSGSVRATSFWSCESSEETDVDIGFAPWFGLGLGRFGAAQSILAIRYINPVLHASLRRMTIAGEMIQGRKGCVDTIQSQWRQSRRW